MNNYQNRVGIAKETRLRCVWVVFLLLGGLVIGRLFILMILQHGYYTALAAGSREVYDDLFPKRGSVFIQDSRTREEFPLAMNHDLFLVFADTRQIISDEEANKVANKLADVFKYDDKKKLEVFLQLNKRTDPYEPIEKKVEEAVVEKLKAMKLPGIGFVRKPFRFYPEGELASNIIGFVGQDEKGNDIGRYGIEGYWQKELAGSGGFMEGAKSAAGGWIPLAGWTFKQAENGADLLLTIDRSIQYQACERLRQGMKEYGAQSAALVVIEPDTGAIRAICSLPDFNPNEYGKVDSARVYNNTAVFTPYEPGSIFKPITMSAAINDGMVSPNTMFNDPGEQVGFCDTPLKNANEKTFGVQTMTGVLENSINTGMVFVVGKLGREKFVDYAQKYGFGVKTGLGLDSESSGTIEALLQKRKNSNKIDCSTATASFGQGIMATPLQMATAFSTIVNGGKLMRPYIVEEARYADGRVERTKPEEIRRVLSAEAASLTSGMLVSVVEKGQSTHAKVAGYYVGGKTGTAQIAGSGGYTNETNHSFIGFAPADNPKFVAIVKFEKPNRAWADSTASPVFQDVAKFVLQYYHVPPSR